MDDKYTNPTPDQGYPNGDLFHYDIGPDQPKEAAGDADYDADGDSDEPFATDERDSEPPTGRDVAEGGVLGLVGGAIVGGLAGGPLGAAIGAVVGGAASAGAVDIVDRHDHDFDQNPNPIATDSDWPSNAIDPNEPLDEQLPNMPGDPVYQTPTLNPNPIVDVPANSDEKLYV